MTTHDDDTRIDPHLPVLPNDGDKGPLRAYIQQELGLVREVRDHYSDYAVHALATLGGIMAGVNLLDAELEQFFIGHAVLDEDGSAVRGPGGYFGGKDTGYCAFLVAERTLALPINDVLAIPRFAHNPVTEVGPGKPGVRAYNAAPLLTTDELVDADGTPLPGGFAFATLWVVDDKPRDGEAAPEWTAEHVAWLKAQADELRDAIVGPYRQRR